MKFTSQQHAAIYTHDKNLIVVAGAGSGKTRVLVERYLALLDSNPGWQLNHLVAITFTEAAAQEMRVRVRQALEKRLADSETLEDQERFSLLLAQMDGARISTIHGLCSEILRANAAEARLDPAFEVLDEVEARLLLERSVDDVLQRLRYDDPDDLLTLFTEYDDYAIRNVLTAPQNMERPLRELPDDPQIIADDVYQSWHTEFQNQIDVLAHDMDFRDALLWADDMSVPPEDKLMKSWRNIQENREKLFDISNDEALKDCVFALNLLTTSQGIDLRGGTQGNWGGKDVKALSVETLRYIRERLNDMKATVKDFDSELEYTAATLLLRWDKLLRLVRYQYQQHKQERALLDFNDLEQGAAALLQHSQVQVRYRGAEFKHLLVDEFQDTNAAQWQIVQALADINTPGSMFVVGDLKQSIYGFRGADVSVFGDVRRTISDRESGQALPLSKSFRSQPGLIAIFNKLFGEMLQPTEGSRVYDYEVQFDPENDDLTASRDDAPDKDASLELILLKRKDESGETISGDMRRQWEAYEIGKRLKNMMDDQFQVFDKDLNIYRDFQYGDAAILLRALTHINVYEDVFKSLGIPYRTLAGRGYYDRQEIWDVMNVLKSLYNSADNLSLAAALRSPMFNFSDEMLLALRLLRDDTTGKIISLWDALQVAQTDNITGMADAASQKKVMFAYQTLTGLKQFAGRVTISELLRQILAETGYLAMLTGLSDGARRRLNVEKLLEIADASGRITPGDFARYIDDLTTKSAREGEAYLEAEGAVRFMSIHASKGLEFPIVILAHASSGAYHPDSNPVQIDPVYGLSCKVYSEIERKFVKPYLYADAEDLQKQRDAAEKKRLLYVAMTRARDRLILAGDYNHEQNTSSGWLGDMLELLEDEPANNGLIPYTEKGHISLYRPLYDADMMQQLSAAALPSTGDITSLSEGVDPVEPPLIAQPKVEAAAFMGHIAATSLADLGWYVHERNVYQRRKIRRETLHDAPGRVYDVVRDENPRVTQRMIGNIMHEALRYWRFPSSSDELTDTLKAYIWQQHITDENLVVIALKRTHELLQDFQQTEMYQWIDDARQNQRPMYPELPFIYRTEKRIIHGIIDMLFQRADGSWVVLDYKTSYVPDYYDNKEEAVQKHVRRYQLQVGAYAAAVMEQLNGVIPDVYVHYLRYNHSVRIPAGTWQTELKKLEKYIGQVIDYDAS